MLRCWVKEHNVKQIFLAAAMAVLLLGNAGAAQENTQLVDSFTGEEVTDGSSSVLHEQERISDRVIYDRKEDSYIYTAANGRVYTNVVDGMITQDAVSISADDAVGCTLYLDGERLDDPDLSAITQTGSYVLETANSTSSEPLFSFTIISDIAGASLSGYRVPAGFAVDSVSVDGVERSAAGGYIDLSEEGAYAIAYECPAADKFYSLGVYIDHTPPTLALDAVVDGRARGPVDVSDLEEGVAMLVYRNGEEVTVYNNEIDRSGDYTIELMDAAGNRTTYTFTIMVYLNISAWAVVLLLVLIGVALMVYLIVSRRRLHVR